MNATPETATSFRYQQASAVASYRLMQSPEYQAERIATHYASHATLALQLVKLIEMRQYSDGSKNVDDAIQSLVATIKRNHLHDFGIELEWPQNDFSRRPEATAGVP